MKLVTYDGGKVGRIERRSDEIVRLDVPDMRTYFERGGADDTGERTLLADARLEAPIIPKKFFHTAGNFREHEEESKTRRLVARDRAPGSSSSRTSTRSSAPTSRSSTRST